jgi:hypothetical protein
LGEPHEFTAGGTPGPEGCGPTAGNDLEVEELLRRIRYHRAVVQEFAENNQRSITRSDLFWQDLNRGAMRVDHRVQLNRQPAPHAVERPVRKCHAVQAFTLHAQVDIPGRIGLCFG